jgi:hypothetical protein
MSTTVRSVPAAVTGAVFAVVLTLANGDGTSMSTAQHVLATAALTLLIPFAVYVGAILRARATNATDTWLATTAVAAGAVGTCMKLLSDAPEIAKSDPRILAGGQTYAALEAVAGATTVLALIPLAVFALASGVAAVRTHALPRWLGVAALMTGAGLVVNGCFLHSENVPALLVLALWCLLTSIHLVRAARRHEVGATSVSAASAA